MAAAAARSRDTNSEMNSRTSESGVCEEVMTRLCHVVLQKFCCEACHFTALTGGKGDMAEALLVSKGVNQDGKGIV
jgi:hypothetical protein